MPDRIVRLGILTSEAVNKLSFQAEVFYRRLMSVVDDYGRFDGRTVVLRASLYPLQLDAVRNGHLETWIGECLDAGLVRLYQCSDGKPHLEIVKFGQRIQSKSKWPDPVDYKPLPESTVKHRESPPIRSRDSESDAKSKSDSGATAFPFLDNPLAAKAWENWLSHLKEKKVKTTPKATEAQIEKCSAWGVSRTIAALRHSTANNYQGLFEPNSNGLLKPVPIARPKPQPATDTVPLAETLPWIKKP